MLVFVEHSYLSCLFETLRRSKACHLEGIDYNLESQLHISHDDSCTDQSSVNHQLIHWLMELTGTHANDTLTPPL